MPTRHTLLLLAAFAAVYFVWGSTYLAISILVSVAPPFLTAGLRSVLAGGILLAWARTRGAPAPSRDQWIFGAVAGGLMFLVGHGTLFWASQHVASGFAAVVESTIPIWVTAFAAFGPRGRVPPPATGAGLLLGVGGVTWLCFPRSGPMAPPSASLALLVGAAVWAAAMVWYRGPRRPPSVALAAAIPLLTGGVLLLVASVAFEDLGARSAASVTPVAIASLAYLVVFGSVVAFSAFAWLVTVASPTAVATYALVNPVVALLLGWTIRAEPMTRATLLPAALILAALALVMIGERYAAGESTGTDPGVIAPGGLPVRAPHAVPRSSTLPCGPKLAATDVQPSEVDL